MTNRKTSQEEISDRLREAVDGLRKDATRVEIWATALGTFAKPVPEYRPNSSFDLEKDRNTDEDPSDSKPD